MVALGASAVKAANDTILYSFCSQSSCSDGGNPYAGVINVNGMLYGTTQFGGDGAGVVFSLDPSTGAETVLHAFSSTGGDGQLPSAGLVLVKEILYGATAGGGANNCGTISRLI
jgi:uncharacterized repeat protein (TIGR03803 family)